MDIEKAITEGIVFKGGKSPNGKKEEKVKTKAKKKSYITGLHGSGSAKMKEEFRKKRASRHKGNKCMATINNEWNLNKMKGFTHSFLKDEDGFPK